MTRGLGGPRGKSLKIADTSAQDVQLRPKGNKQRTLIGGVLALAALIFLWTVVPAISRWADASITVPFERLRIAAVTRGDLVRDVSVEGRVIAAVSPTLYASAGGTINLLVDAGAKVIEGQRPRSHREP